MRSSIILSIVALFAASVSAQADSADALSHGSYIASRMRRRANVDLNSGEYMKRNVQVRDATPSTSSSAPVPTNTGFVNLNPTIEDTQMACMNALPGQTADSSGFIPCFNVNFFDNSTGSFQANILVYKVNTTSWTTLQAKSINFPAGVTWNTVNTSAPITKRDDAATPVDTSATPIRRVLAARSDAATLEFNYTVLGTVGGTYANMLTNSTAMREALTPNVTVQGSTADKQTMNDTLVAPTDLSFVDGWFSQMYLNQQMAIKTAVAPPFTLPGVTLGISKGLYPIGLEVTSAWVIVFTAVVGYGTFGRWQWRRAYRQGKPTASGR